MPRNDIDRLVGRFKPGSRTISARQLNALVDGVNRALVGVNRPTQPKPTGKAGGGSPVIVLTLISHQDDYLECQDGNSNTVYVAKPYMLRRTPFDGVAGGGVAYEYSSSFAANQQRIATSVANPSEVETQYITPTYTAGEEIYAVKVQGVTGVQLPTSPPTDLVYIEVNQGRAFAWDGV